MKTIPTDTRDLGCSEKAKESFTAFVDVMQCEMDLEISDLSGYGKLR